MLQNHSSRQSFYVDAEGPDREAFARGFQWLNNAVNSKPSQMGYLITPTKANLSGVISSVVGEAAAKALGAGKVLHTGSGGQIFHLTEATLRHKLIAGPVLVAYGGKKLIDAVDDHYEISSLAIVPWLRDDISAWVRAYNPQELTGKPSKAAPPPNKVLTAALQSLTDRCNVSTGLAHPSDKAATVQMFRHLKGGKEVYDRDQTKAELIQMGWDSKDAERVAQMGVDIYAGKGIRSGRGGDNQWAPDILAIWRANAHNLP